jgi:mRNA-capping enzyme
LKLISQSIVTIRDNAIREGHIKKTTQPFSIRSKYFVGLSEANKLFRPKSLANIPHKVEALFFLPEKDPYTPGECQDVLKWKENEMIEFRLKIIPNSSNRGALPEKNAHLFLCHKKVDTHYDTMPYSPNLEQYDNEIISCSYKDSEWHFHRIRKDRPFPNSYQTAMDVMKAVKEPITKELLYNLIKNQSKKRVLGDDSSSNT